jgi:hypothetical protein
MSIDVRKRLTKNAMPSKLLPYGYVQRMRRVVQPFCQGWTTEGWRPGRGGESFALEPRWIVQPFFPAPLNSKANSIQCPTALFEQQNQLLGIKFTLG